MFAKRFPTSDTKVRVGVGVLLKDDSGRLLLEKRADCGMWGLLGGKIDPGESIEKAAHREVMEESGLKIEILRLIGVYSEREDRIVTYPDNGDVVHLVDVVLEAVILEGSMRISSESIELRFFSPDELPSDIVPPAIIPIRDYLHGQACVLS